MKRYIARVDGPPQICAKKTQERRATDPRFRSAAETQGTRGVRLSSLSIRKKILFTCLVMLMAMLILESAARTHRAKLTSFRSVHRHQNILDRHVPVTFSPRFGWVSTPGAESTSGHITITIDDEGFRSNGRGTLYDGRPILAVGDSFTFGEEVDDWETWPAQLEPLIERRVLNAGVTGFGFDQIVLRSEELASQRELCALVVAIIGDDVLRCQYAYRWGGWKPYFDIVEDELVLRNSPVKLSLPPEPEYSAVRRALGYSHLADMVLRRITPEWWLSESGILQVHRRGTDVSCLLVERLAGIQDMYGIPVMLVVEHAAGTRRPPVRPVLANARSNGLAVLDLSTDIDQLIHTDPSVRARHHLSAKGNAWVARRIAGALQEFVPGNSHP